MGFGDWRGKFIDFAGLLNDLIKVIINSIVEIHLLESFPISNQSYYRSEGHQTYLNYFFLKLHSIYFINDGLLHCVESCLTSMDLNLHATANVNAENQNLFRFIPFLLAFFSF
jgi:hypothetical protein